MATRQQIEEALKTVEDPEIHIDIFTLGLIYDIRIEKKKVQVLMTFTFPGCPYGPLLVDEVKEAIERLDDVDEAEVEITFTPPWEPSEELRATMGMGL
ncbi:MAG: metal-sulfur cluster assembly factor [DPANN group archaeon]|nr:metal-sulfur cluster assembly factor [DPANN group archaeon]